MTVMEIRDVILQADPDAQHYEAALDGRDFTVWMEYERIGLRADDEYAEAGWRFEVDRYTKQEFDPIAELLEEVLDAADGVTWTHRVQYNQQTGYIRHIYDCEAV